MRDPANIKAIAAHTPDYIGLIFYEKSPRFAGGMDPSVLDVLSPETKRVGVFVNADVHYVREKARRYRLNALQLHGDETPDFCEALRCEYEVIKAFGIESAEDLEYALPYEDACDYFLFDAKTPHRGGAGVKFDHSILQAYPGETLYFLSGGIGPQDARGLMSIADQRCAAIDVNSRFEIAPALKDTQAVMRFINEIRNS